MSGQDYTKRTDKVRKQLNTLRKDINYRDQQDKRGEATYTLDAEINGQFTQINEELEAIEIMANNFKASFKDYNLTYAEATKRYKVYETLLNDKNSLKRTYDSLFQKKTQQRDLLSSSSEDPTVSQKYDTKNMTTKQLNNLREEQDNEQDKVLDELIVNVKNLKQGGKAINQQLTEQEGLLQTLDNKMDDNMESMSATRRKLAKLLESSSNCCLVSVMIIEIAVVILIWVLL